MEAKYRPFEDSTDAFKYAAIDLSEWEGHETEEYLEIFMKFIHDYTGYFNFKYIFITGCIEKGHIKNLSHLLHRYLGVGEVLMDKTFMDEKVMSTYIANKYNVEKSASKRLASCFLDDRIGGYAELEMIMQDTKDRLKSKNLIDMEDIQMLVNTKLSKLLLEMPLIGTLIFNIKNTKQAYRNLFETKYFYNPFAVRQSFIKNFV